MQSTSRDSRRYDHSIASAVAFVALAMAAIVVAGPAQSATGKKSAPVAMEAEPAMAAPPTPATTLERIKAAGKIVLGYRSGSAANTAAEPKGYAVTLCNRVAETLKRDHAWPSVAVEWVAAAPGYGDLDTHRVDLICDADEVTLANREKASFSIPIFPGGVSALVRADAPGSFTQVIEEQPRPYQPLWRGTPPPTLMNRTYSALVGSATLDAVMARIKTMRLIANVDPVADYDAGATAVARGNTDVLFGDRDQLLQAVQRSSAAKDLRVLSRRFTFAAVALALSRNDDDFRLAVDRVLTQVYLDPQFGALYTATFGAPDAGTVEFFRNVAGVSE